MFLEYGLMNAWVTCGHGMYVFTLFWLVASIMPYV